MTATDELRKLLDERGVEWTANDGEYVKETCWTYMGELTAAFAEYNDGTTRFDCDTWCFTPEQAIEATLRDGTCHNVGYRLDESRFHCSECERGGWWRDVADGRDKVPRFCPNCGRKVMRDGS